MQYVLDMAKQWKDKWMMAIQTDNRTYGKISMDGVDCVIGINEGLHPIQTDDTGHSCCD